MAKQKDVFGFDELEKAVERMGKNYETEADRFLNAMASQAAKRMRQVTTKGPERRGRAGKHMKNAYETQKPKEYPGKNVKVSRVRNKMPYGHLPEFGHEAYTTKGKTGKVNKYSWVGKAAKGIKHHGRVEGKFLFEKVWKDFEWRFYSESEKLLKKITQELQVK